MFEGCSHAFHLTCLREIQYCPLCQKLLQHKAKSLAITAKNAILNRRIKENKESESDAPEGEVDSNDTVEDSNINIPKCEISNAEGNIVNTNRRITSLAPIAPPSQKKQKQQQQQQQQTQMATEVVTVIKTPHCKQCGQPVKGHKRPKGEKVKCEQCPTGVCTSSANGVAVIVIATVEKQGNSIYR